MIAARKIIVMPAYNAQRTLERTLRDIPHGFADEILVGDDGSCDKTVEIAKGLGLTVTVHDKNRGYGANQKTLYTEALRRGPDIIVMIHHDYQYDCSLVPSLTDPIEKGLCDITLGSRIRTRKECTDSGMPLYKYVGNRFLTILQNLTMGQRLSEWHTGYRAYSTKVLETIPYMKNANGFVFDFQFLIEAVHFGFRIKEFPIPCRYMSAASSVNFKSSITYGTGTIKTLIQYILHRLRLVNCGLFESKKKTNQRLRCHPHYSNPHEKEGGH